MISQENRLEERMKTACPEKSGEVKDPKEAVVWGKQELRRALP